MARLPLRRAHYFLCSTPIPAPPSQENRIARAWKKLQQNPLVHHPENGTGRHVKSMADTRHKRPADHSGETRRLSHGTSLYVHGRCRCIPGSRAAAEQNGSGHKECCSAYARRAVRETSRTSRRRADPPQDESRSKDRRPVSQTSPVSAANASPIHRTQSPPVQPGAVATDKCMARRTRLKT